MLGSVQPLVARTSARRNFIAGLSGAVAWSLAAQAQQGEGVRRIGVLMGGDENDPFLKLQRSTLTQALADLGWVDGRNVRMDFRCGIDDINRIRAFARELVSLQPEIIVTARTPQTAALQRETQTIPIVFANTGDPVASGLVARLEPAFAGMVQQHADAVFVSPDALFQGNVGPHFIITHGTSLG